MTRKFVFQWVFVLLLLSLPGLASPTLQGSAELSLERAILAEPVMLQACLLAPAIDGNQVLVSSEMLMTLSMVGPQGPCKRARNIQGLEVNPGSLWMVPIFLTKESPRWCKQICLNEEFVLQGAGDYLVTIEWLRRPVDEKARMNILSETKLKFPGKALFFEEGFFFSKQISLRIEPPSGLDKKAYEGTNQCPLCEPAILLQRFPTSTYAGYILRAPAASFGCSSYDCFENAEEALRTECNRGGGEEVVQRCMRNERQRMEAYARAARAFLEAHPDFWAAPRIRRELAFCLAFTGRLPEALEHVEILAQGEGKEAQEAKAYLGARERRGAVAQERRGENKRTASEADGR